MKINFSKMHGIGNDFIIINNLLGLYNFTATQIQFMANRHFGIGADQILLVEKATDGLSDFYYKIYNSDGSIANQCGNGARCFIRYLIKNGLTNKRKIQLQTEARVISGEILATGMVTINMGKPSFGLAEALGEISNLAEFDAATVHLALNQSFHLNQTDQFYYTENIDGNLIKFTYVNMGNPHVVIFVENINILDDEDYLTRISQFLQTAKYFPDSVNVNFVYLIDDKTIKLRTYERGAGFTLGCGSGACASAVITMRDRLLQIEAMHVQMLGGTLKIEWKDKEDVWMQGSAMHVFDGIVEL